MPTSTHEVIKKQNTFYDVETHEDQKKQNTFYDVESKLMPLNFFFNNN